MTVNANDSIHNEIEIQKKRLDLARISGDPLRIELAENGLNALLEQLSQVTNKGADNE